MKPIIEQLECRDTPSHNTFDTALYLELPINYVDQVSWSYPNWYSFDVEKTGSFQLSVSDPSLKFNVYAYPGGHYHRNGEANKTLMSGASGSVTLKLGANTFYYVVVWQSSPTQTVSYTLSIHSK